LIIQTIKSTIQPITTFLLRTPKTWTLFGNNYDSRKKNIASFLLESTNSTPPHQGGLLLQLLVGGLPLQFLLNLHHLQFQQSTGSLKPSVPVN